MMACVGEEEWDAEQQRRFRDFQEFQQFQRFQEYLRNLDQRQGSGPTPGQAPGQQAIDQPAPDQPTVPGGELAVPGPARPLSPTQPAAPAPPSGPPPQVAAQAHDVGAQLAQVREQLAELTETQRRIDRTVNPPWWRRVSRSRPVRWLVIAVLVIIVGIWGVPLLINHYFGNGGSTGSGGATNPGTVGEQHGYFSGPRQAVQAVYDSISGVNPDTAQVCGALSAQAVRDFAAATGTQTCTQAIGVLAKRITDSGYGDNADQAVRTLPEAPASGQSPVTVYACAVPVTGGPTLGTFTLTLHAAGQWEVTGYLGPATCNPPAPTTGTSTTKASTAETSTAGTTTGQPS